MSTSRYDVVRVKAPNGRTRTATRAEAERIGGKVLPGEAVRDRYGRPVPAKPTPGKPRLDLSTKNGTTPSEAATQAVEKKENR